MNNNPEALLKLVVPAIFFILWAVNQLFNKEKAAARGAVSPIFGPRPGGLPPAPRPGERGRPQSPPYRDVTYEQAPALGRRPNPGSGRQADDLLVIRDERRPTPAQSAKPRGARPQAPPTNPARSGRGSSQAGRNPAGAGKAPPAPPAYVSVTPTALMSDLPSKISDQGPMPFTQLRDSLTNPQRVREAFLLNELIQPPVSMRRGTTPRRRLGL